MLFSDKISIPADGVAIVVSPAGDHLVPDNPIIPFIEGDGIGADITPVMRQVIDAAADQAYAGQRKIHWMEIYAGEKACQVYGEGVWLPEETIEALKRFSVSIKGPLTTPVGGGVRSLNVAMRQMLDLYLCIRPVRYFSGTPSPLKSPEKTDMVIFRENTEDIYVGIEWQAGTPEVKKVLRFLQEEMGVNKIRFPATSSIGIKPVSEEGTKRLVRRALQYAIDHDRDSVTLVHKGNIMKYTEGSFKNWGYELAREEFEAEELEGGPWCHIANPKTGREILVKDVIADAFLQEILLQPEDFSVIATLNLNGDFISDALAAQVGGIGIAPGANLSDEVAIFEATHGTAPKIAGQNRANPGSIILSAEMMLRHIGWLEAADLVLKGVSSAIHAHTVTEDFATHMESAVLVGTREFGRAVIAHMRP